jgi:hypothetical protein
MTRAAASEQATHQVIATYLTRALPPGSLHFAIDSAGKASLAIAQRLKARGGMRGTPDHCCLIPTIRGALFLEVKTAIGVVSPEQKHVACRITDAGHHWFCVRSVEDVEALLREMYVPLRASVSGIRESIAAQNEGLKPIRKRAAGGKRVARPTQAQVRRAEAARRLPA